MSEQYAKKRLTSSGLNMTVAVMFNLRVRRIDFLTPELFELGLGKGNYSFQTGECAVLFNGAGDSRPYSFSSAPEEKLLRFLIRRVPGGSVSEWLASRTPGDVVCVSHPFGAFRPGLGKEPVVFIATGVGISPFMSALRSRNLEAESVHCLYGVRRMDEAFPIPLLRHRVVLHLAVSRETTIEHFHGRVTGCLKSLSLPEDANYYLCGCNAMVDEVFNLLHARHIPASRIRSEVFFSSSEK